jgi:23S rRNA (uracil1939-C5)-methyltransferase
VTNSPVEVLIDRLGAQGDGIAETPGGPQFIPFALPGERVRPAGAGLPQILSAPNHERREPVCRRFGTCGGCVAQHMGDDLYSRWKRNILLEALRQRGLDAEVAPLRRVPAASRRRAVLTARREGRAIVLGYHGRRSRDLFAVEECPVLHPEIVASFRGLRAVASLLVHREIRLTVLMTRSGLDIAIEDSNSGPLDTATAAELAQLAAQHGLARISRNGNVIIERAKPVLAMGGAGVSPPPGAFVQAVAEAETEMVHLVVAGAGKAKRIADLFCGIGTFTLPLAHHARVLAVDGDRPALAALEAAARHTQGLKPIEPRLRDLFRIPLSPRELEGFDAVVLDPARAGAEAQARQLAQARVPTIVYVSCNPGTLARDARILVDGGYVIESVVPIDQFLYSHHVEAVAVLRRTARGSR